MNILIESLSKLRLLGYLYGVFYRNVEAKYLLNLYISLVQPHLNKCGTHTLSEALINLKIYKSLHFVSVLANGPQGMRIFCKYFNFLDYLVNRSTYVWLLYFNSMPTFLFPPWCIDSNCCTASHAYMIPYAHTTAY